MTDHRPDGQGATNGPKHLTAEIKARLLLEISHTIRGTLDLDEILDHLLDTVRSVLDYDAAGIFVLKADVFPGLGRATELIAGVARRGFDQHPVESDAMLTFGDGVVVPEVHLDPRYVEGRASTRSEVAVPIAVNGRTIGALNLESDRVAAYDEGAVEVLRFFSDAAAIAIEKAILHRQLVEKQHLEGQLRIAHEVQLRLLPHAPPAIPGYDIAGLCLPSSELAGDCFDYPRLDQGRLGIVIADVAGKGIPAALIMATFRAFVRSLLGVGLQLPAAMIEVNRHLRESARPRAFVTGVCGILEPASGRFSYVNCGHEPPLLVRTHGDLEELSYSGPVLGVFEGADYQAHEVVLAPGDTLVLHTDGVGEARSPSGELFGAERLAAIVQVARRRPAAKLADEVVSQVRTFTATQSFADDFTLVIVKRCG
jgi:sigma-B regulation protein RsbU (phosphoserine phosphatase)